MAYENNSSKNEEQQYKNQYRRAMIATLVEEQSVTKEELEALAKLYGIDTKEKK